MTREELIAAMQADGADEIIRVEFKRWGTVCVRALSVKEAEKMHVETDGEDGRSSLAVLAASVICDEEGKRIFDPQNPDDVELLARRRSADLMRIINAGTDSGN